MSIIMNWYSPVLPVLSDSVPMRIQSPEISGRGQINLYGLWQDNTEDTSKSNYATLEKYAVPNSNTYFNITGLTNSYIGGRLNTLGNARNLISAKNQSVVLSDGANVCIKGLATLDTISKYLKSVLVTTDSSNNTITTDYYTTLSEAWGKEDFTGSFLNSDGSFELSGYSDTSFPYELLFECDVDYAVGDGGFVNFTANKDILGNVLAGDNNVTQELFVIYERGTTEYSFYLEDKSLYTTQAVKYGESIIDPTTLSGAVPIEYTSETYHIDTYNIDTELKYQFSGWGDKSLETPTLLDMSTLKGGQTFITSFTALKDKYIPVLYYLTCEGVTAPEGYSGAFNDTTVNGVKLTDTAYAATRLSANYYKAGTTAVTVPRIHAEYRNVAQDSSGNYMEALDCVYWSTKSDFKDELSGYDWKSTSETATLTVSSIETPLILYPYLAYRTYIYLTGTRDPYVSVGVDSSVMIADSTLPNSKTYYFEKTLWGTSNVGICIWGSLLTNFDIGLNDYGITVSRIYDKTISIPGSWIVGSTGQVDFPSGTEMAYATGDDVSYSLQTIGVQSISLDLVWNVINKPQVSFTGLDDGVTIAINSSSSAASQYSYDSTNKILTATAANLSSIDTAWQFDLSVMTFTRSGYILSGYSPNPPTAKAGAVTNVTLSWKIPPVVTFNVDSTSYLSGSTANYPTIKVNGTSVSVNSSGIATYQASSVGETLSVECTCAGFEINRVECVATVNSVTSTTIFTPDTKMGQPRMSLKSTFSVEPETDTAVNLYLQGAQILFNIRTERIVYYRNYECDLWKGEANFNILEEVNQYKTTTDFTSETIPTSVYAYDGDNYVLHSLNLRMSEIEAKGVTSIKYWPHLKEDSNAQYQDYTTPIINLYSVTAASTYGDAPIIRIEFYQTGTALNEVLVEKYSASEIPNIRYCAYSASGSSAKADGQMLCDSTGELINSILITNAGMTFQAYQTACCYLHSPYISQTNFAANGYEIVNTNGVATAVKIRSDASYDGSGVTITLPVFGTDFNFTDNITTSLRYLLFENIGHDTKWISDTNYDISTGSVTQYIKASQSVNINTETVGRTEYSGSASKELFEGYPYYYKKIGAVQNDVGQYTLTPSDIQDAFWLYEGSVISGSLSLLPGQSKDMYMCVGFDTLTEYNNFSYTLDNIAYTIEQPGIRIANNELSIFGGGSQPGDDKWQGNEHYYYSYNIASGDNVAYEPLGCIRYREGTYAAETSGMYAGYSKGGGWLYPCGSRYNNCGYEPFVPKQISEYNTSDLIDITSCSDITSKRYNVSPPTSASDYGKRLFTTLDITFVALRFIPKVIV